MKDTYPALFINLAAWNSFFFSNDACLEFFIGSLQSGRSHAVPFQYLGRPLANLAEHFAAEREAAR